MREKFFRFMQGRYGGDQLSRFMSFLAIALIIIEFFTRARILTAAVFVLLVLIYFRAFSRNIYKRAAENQKFLQIYGKTTGWFRRKTNRIKQSRTHAFYRCPDCKQTVRVPKGKGRIEITCPKCHARFIEKT